MKVRRTFWLAGCLMALSAVGCFKGGAIPKRINWHGEASPKTNPDSAGNPLSVVVRFYQLKDKTEFMKLTLDGLSSERSDGELFGQSLVAKSEVVVVPGNSIAHPDDLQPATQYVAIVGFFRDADPNFWRVIVPAKGVRKAKSLVLRVHECYLDVTGVAPIAVPGVPIGAVPRCLGTPKAAAIR